MHLCREIYVVRCTPNFDKFPVKSRHEPTVCDLRVGVCVRDRVVLKGKETGYCLGLPEE